MTGERVTLPSGSTIDPTTWADMAADGTWRGWLDGRMYTQDDRDFMDKELSR
jgi:hypothetical protein